jgi:hypothetical protein
MSWCQTFTGKQFWPLEPNSQDVCLEDIAHALALQCRFNGHCRCFYSIAEHSLRVTQILPPELQLLGLFHDAAEAYVGDMVRPLKRQLPAFEVAEREVWAVLAAKFGLPESLPREVVHADNTLLATEARDIMAPTPAPWVPLPDPLPERIVPWNWRYAESYFLQRARQLGVE